MNIVVGRRESSGAWVLANALPDAEHAGVAKLTKLPPLPSEAIVGRQSAGISDPIASDQMPTASEF